jgi:hypothetical protein
MDHLKEAKAAAISGKGYVEDGEGSEDAAHVLFHAAEVHAQIAQAEQLQRLGDLFDANADLSPGLIGVTGHVTTSAP